MGAEPGPTALDIDLGLAAFLAHMIWQTVSVDIDDPEHCLAIFRANNKAGLLLLAGLLADLMF